MTSAYRVSEEFPRGIGLVAVGPRPRAQLGDSAAGVREGQLAGERAAGGVEKLIRPQQDQLLCLELDGDLRGDIIGAHIEDLSRR